MWLCFLGRNSDLGLCHLNICLSRLGLQIAFPCLNPQSSSPRAVFIFLVVTSVPGMSVPFLIFKNLNISHLSVLFQFLISPGFDLFLAAKVLLFFRKGRGKLSEPAFLIDIITGIFLRRRVQDGKSNLLRVITTKPTVKADFFHQGQTLLYRLLVGRRSCCSWVRRLETTGWIFCWYFQFQCYPT